MKSTAPEPPKGSPSPTSIFKSSGSGFDNFKTSGPNASSGYDNPQIHGQLVDVVWAVTDGAPEGWSGPGAGDEMGKPTNLIDTKKRYKSVTITLVVRNRRPWKNKGAAGDVKWAGMDPYLEHSVSVAVNEGTGDLTVGSVTGTGWNQNSEGVRQGDGGAVAAQLTYVETNAPPGEKIIFKYSGSGGWTTEGIVTHDNTGPNPKGGALAQKCISEGKINDNQGGTVSIGELVITSVKTPL